jgi:hypothetical protein
LDPEQQFNQIISWLGLPSQNEVINEKKKSRLDEKDNLIRLNKWLSGLSPEEIQKILWWKDRFGINQYNKNIYPVREKDN